MNLATRRPISAALMAAPLLGAACQNDDQPQRVTAPGQTERAPAVEVGAPEEHPPKDDVASAASPFDSPDLILRPPGEAVPHILLVGTFHFAYPGLDQFRVAKDDEIDVLSTTRQAEMRALVQYLERFRPTKIAIESREANPFAEDLSAYRAGKFELERDEIHQIAFRLAAKQKHERLYGCDTGSFANELERQAPKLFERVWRDGPDQQSPNNTQERYTAWYRAKSRQATRASLLEYFRFMNAPHTHRRVYGAYLTGTFRSAPQGPDQLALYWYDRNLRTFRCLQDVATDPHDRVLILMGNGHAAVLRHLFQSSPEFKLVEFDSLAEVVSAETK